MFMYLKLISICRQYKHNILTLAMQCDVLKVDFNMQTIKAQHFDFGDAIVCT